MAMDDVDQVSTADNPRKRLLLSAVAMVLPVVALVGAAAWFVRSHVLPPTVSIDTMQPRAAEEPAAMPAAQTVAAPETTGIAAPTAPNPPEPTVRYTNNSADIWAAVPIPGPPRSIQRLDPEPDALASDPPAGPVPLPPPRPQSSTSSNIANSAVPLPRPRPVSSN